MINVVGFSSEIDKQTITDDLTSLNPSVKSAIELDESEEEKSIEVLAIRPLKNNGQFFRANIRVSNNVRRAIANQGDRVYTCQGSKKYMTAFIFEDVISVRSMAI